MDNTMYVKQKFLYTNGKTNANTSPKINHRGEFAFVPVGETVQKVHTLDIMPQSEPASPRGYHEIGAPVKA